MRYLITAFLLAFCACSSSAQESDQYSNCSSKARTQAELNVCANQEAMRADAELERIYATILSKAERDPLATEKVKALEKAWISYRDAYIGAMYPAEDKQGQYGSMFPMEADLLYAKLTREHITALKELLEQYTH